MDRSELELRYETMLEEYPDTKIIFSEGAAEQFAELMNAEKASSVVIFTGSSKGAAAKAMPNLQNFMAYMNLDFRFYMDIPAEPAVTDVRDMVRMLEEEKPQFVAALGGGSVMDAAKAAYLSWQSGLDVTDLFGVNQATRKCRTENQARHLSAYDFRNRFGSHSLFQYRRPGSRRQKTVMGRTDHS